MANLTGSPEPAPTEGTKSIWNRSAFRLWLFGIVVVLVGAWANDLDIMQAVKDRAVEWLVEFGGVIGLAATTKSGKVVKE